MLGRNETVVQMTSLPPKKAFINIFAFWLSQWQAVPFERAKSRVTAALKAERKAEEIAKQATGRKFPYIFNDMSAIWYDLNDVNDFPGNYQIGRDEYYLLRHMNQNSGKRDSTQWGRRLIAAAAADAANEVTIIDYGCGLAHRSLPLTFLLVQKMPVHLVLVDTFKPGTTSFLMCACASVGARCTFLPITHAGMIPSLPRGAQYVIADEVLEHVPKPIAVLEELVASLAPHGLLKSNLGDHKSDSRGHISADLSAVRSRALALGLRLLKQPDDGQKHVGWYGLHDLETS